MDLQSYFDTYQTRIAANCRGETNIYIISYNHSFTGITTECILNTINPEDSNPPQIPEKLNLSNVISGLKLSKDGYFLSVTDYAAGVRIFNFSDFGILGLGAIPGNQTSESNEENVAAKNTSEQNNNVNNENEKKNNVEVIGTIPQVGEHKLNFTYVGRFVPDKTENFTIIPNEAQQVEDKNKKNVKENVKDKKN